LIYSKYVFMHFKNKTAIITGAASGIGYAVSQALVKQGACVFCFDWQKPKIPVAGVTYCIVDVTSSAAIKRALAKVNGGIDILFNNAGVMRRGTVLASAEKDFDLLFNVHVKGSWLMLKYCQPRLRKNATIVQMSSRHALYFPSDPGLYALVKRTALDLAELVEQTYPAYRIKVLCPGPVDTPLSRTDCDETAWARKKKMVCEPSFLAEHIVELLNSDKSKLIFDQKNCNYYFE